MEEEAVVHGHVGVAVGEVAQTPVTKEKYAWYEHIVDVSQVVKKMTHLLDSFAFVVVQVGDRMEDRMNTVVGIAVVPSLQMTMVQGVD